MLTRKLNNAVRGKKIQLIIPVPYNVFNGYKVFTLNGRKQSGSKVCIILQCKIKDMYNFDIKYFRKNLL